MKRTYIISIFAAIVAGSIFCSSKPVSCKEIEPEMVLQTIGKLDSIVSTLHGFEPVEIEFYQYLSITKYGVSV